MEQLIIDQMRSELFDTRLCKQDFEKYDTAQLLETDEPFLWMVREHGTSLALIGPTQMDKMFHSESWRIALMKNPLDAIANILYWNDETAKYFYWSGYELCRIEKNELGIIYQRIWSGRIKKLQEEYPEEYAVINMPLELVMSLETEKQVCEAKIFAQSLNDDSLSNCLKRLSNWTRQAVNHKVEIYLDFTLHSFGFCEKINDKPNINGAVIFNPHATQNRWSIHT